MMSLTTPDLTIYISKLRSRRPEYRSLLDLYSFFYQEIEREGSRVTLPPYQLEQRETMLSEGRPLFAPGELPVDMESARRLMGASLGATVPEKDQRDRLALFFQSKPEQFENACQLLLRGDWELLAQMARKATLDPALLIVLLRMSIRPSCLALRKVVGVLDAASWNKGYCPLCGAPPLMARLEKDGRRTLGCSLCGHEWSFPRLACPFCQTEDQNLLYYLAADDEEAYRIYACGRCRGYVKTVDARLLEEPAPLELEDLITIHLDMIAQEKGLTPYYQIE